MLRQSRCRALVTMTGFAGLDHLGMLDEIAPGWDAGPTRRRCPTCVDVVQLSTDRCPDGPVSPRCDDLAADGDAAPGASADRSPEPGDLGDILYTSGTTGSPKGVLVTPTTRCSAPATPRR